MITKNRNLLDFVFDQLDSMDKVITGEKTYNSLVASDEGYMVSLPGFKTEEIDVKQTGNKISITASSKTNPFMKEYNYIFLCDKKIKKCKYTENILHIITENNSTKIQIE